MVFARSWLYFQPSLVSLFEGQARRDKAYRVITSEFAEMLGTSEEVARKIYGYKPRKKEEHASESEERSINPSKSF